MEVFLVRLISFSAEKNSEQGRQVYKYQAELEK